MFFNLSTCRNEYPLDDTVRFSDFVMNRNALIASYRDNSVLNLVVRISISFALNIAARGHDLGLRSVYDGSFFLFTAPSRILNQSMLAVVLGLWKAVGAQKKTRAGLEELRSEQ